MSLLISGLSKIDIPFKAVILDAWGVLHNGIEVYPYVLDCLTQLRKHDKKILVLSNAPRVKASVQESLLKCGIAQSYYDFLHSSGEEGFITLRDQNIFGESCYHMGELTHRGIFDHLALRRTEDISQAKFLLNTGFINKDLVPDSKDDLLQEALTQNLLMLCFNPDYKVNVGSNILLCAGAYAKRYEELGGKVHYFGKPHANVYMRALDMLEIDNPKDVIAIGDSFATDMQGGLNAGISTILTLTGIHAPETTLNEEFNPSGFKSMCDSYKIQPNYVIPELRW